MGKAAQGTGIGNTHETKGGGLVSRSHDPISAHRKSKGQPRKGMSGPLLGWFWVFQ